MIVGLKRGAIPLHVLNPIEHVGNFVAGFAPELRFDFAAGVGHHGHQPYAAKIANVETVSTVVIAMKQSSSMVAPLLLIRQLLEDHAGVSQQPRSIRLEIIHGRAVLSLNVGLQLPVHDEAIRAIVDQLQPADGLGVHRDARVAPAIAG